MKMQKAYVTLTIASLTFVIVVCTAYVPAKRFVEHYTDPAVSLSLDTSQ